MLKALHWLRSRQEERELAYWFALVFYDHRDRSFNNRAYFFYLVLFFAVWFFMLLIFIASGGVQLLEMLVPGQPQRAAVICTVVLLALWFIVSLRTSLKRSPLMLSEEDAYLLCQTPLPRGLLVLRWVWMPWFKNAIPVWLATIVLGFSLAEIFLPGDAAVDNLPVYLGYGLRAWVCVLPIHLGLFAFQWLAGILRLQKNTIRRWLHLPFLGGVLVFFYLLLTSLMETTLPLSQILRSIFNTLAFPLHSGFRQGSLLSPVIIGLVFALSMLALLYLAARDFNLTRAAQETQTLNLVQDLQRYGFTDSAKQIQQQQRLGAGRKTVRLPAYPGPAALLWKDILQSRRSLRLPDIINCLALYWLLPFCRI
ncbi:MAG: hypothetical protein CVU39_25405 [Chloroflexi bacterium HGW-Chloroflexi-10]|nr:MAG: hypothetical protein CVU39_25405 [Chloroflexi bacterium HGW-Chloroflexi-10]